MDRLGQVTYLNQANHFLNCCPKLILESPLAFFDDTTAKLGTSCLNPHLLTLRWILSLIIRWRNTCIIRTKPLNVFEWRSESSIYLQQPCLRLYKRPISCNISIRILAWKSCEVLRQHIKAPSISYAPNGVIKSATFLRFLGFFLAPQN